MKIRFCGAFYHMTEKDSAVIDYRYGVPYYMLMHFYSPMVLFIGDEKIITRRDSWVLLRPSTPKRYYSVKGGFANDYVFFECGDEQLIKRYKFPVDEPFYLNGGEDLSNQIGLITWALTDVLNDRQEIMEDALIRIFEVFRDYHCSGSPSRDRRKQLENRLNSLRDEVMSSPASWNVGKMAAHMFLARSHFTALYKARFDISPGEELKRFLADYAERLIIETDMTIADIAEKCGYTNTENFIRFYKKIRGITPAAEARKYRKAGGDKENGGNHGTK